MNILIILPGVYIEYNSIAYTILGLEKFGYFPVIITSRSRGSKSTGTNSDYEEHGKTKIYRIVDKSPALWKAKGTKTETLISDIIERHDVKMLLASTNACCEISSHLASKHSIPNIMMLEFLFHKTRFFAASIREYLGLNFLKPLAWRYHYNKFSKHNNSLITFYNEEEEEALKTPNTYFVPWCNQIPNEILIPDKKENSLIFAGNFSKWTIKDECLIELASILEKKIVDKIHFVGYGVLLYKIEKLKELFGDRIIIHGSLPRNEVLELIAKVKYGIQAATLGGWGFMGECLALKTPLIILDSNKYRLRDAENAIIIKNFGEMHNQISYYNNHPEKYKLLQENGHLAYKQNHTGDKTAEYLAIAIKQTFNEFS